MASDAAVEAVVEAISARLHQTTDLWTHQQYRPAMTADGSSVQEAATAILDALPDLLREDSEAGEALRGRLGLHWIDGDAGTLQSTRGLRWLTSRWEAKP